VPLKRGEAHQECARGIRDVGGMNTTVGAAREVPQQPRVGSAERQLAGFGSSARTGDVVENPGNLGGREVRGQRQASELRETVDALVLGELVGHALRARVLPDNGVVERDCRWRDPTRWWFLAGW
jgi:hypothetical protein